MLQRIRIACGNPYFIAPSYGTVEIDETYIGGLEKNKHSNKKRRKGIGSVGKTSIVTIRSRNGMANSFYFPSVNKDNIHKFIGKFIRKGTMIYTDESRVYTGLSDDYRHETVKHKDGEYVRGDLHTNSVEASMRG